MVTLPINVHLDRQNWRYLYWHWRDTIRIYVHPVSQFLQGSPLWQTDRPHYFVCKTYLGYVEHFVYLDGTVSADQSCDKDIERRIGLASGIVRKLRTVWAAKDISTETKVMLYQTLIQSVVLYNAETWTLKQEQKRKLRVFEMAVLRRICGVTRSDRRRNVDIVNKLAIDRDIVELLQIRRLAYLGHVSRIQSDSSWWTYRWKSTSRKTQEKVDWQYQWGLFFSGDYTYRHYKICTRQKSVEDPSTQLGLPARGDPVFVAKALSQVSQGYVTILRCGLAT